MSKKIEWIKRGMTANNGLHMQEVCDQIANETSPENLTSVIKGSDTVVVDVAEDKKTVEVHLDAEVTQKIDNSLQAPTQAPTATQIVGVGTNKAQTMLNIGDGLSVENGSLKASGGGDKKYMHIIEITGKRSDGVTNAGQIICLIVNNSLERITLNNYKRLIELDKQFIASGTLYDEIHETYCNIADIQFKDYVDFNEKNYVFQSTGLYIKDNIVSIPQVTYTIDIIKFFIDRNVIEL